MSRDLIINLPAAPTPACLGLLPLWEGAALSLPPGDGPQDPRLGDLMCLRRRPSPTIPSQRPQPRAGRVCDSSEHIDLFQGSDPWGSALFLEPGKCQGSVLGWQHPHPHPQASFSRQPRPPHHTEPEPAESSSAQGVAPASAVPSG